MKLGRLPVRHDPRTLRLAKYLAASLPPATDAVKWSGAVPAFPMLLNDSLGDCTIAAALHMEQVWTANAKGQPTAPTDSAALEAYERICRYNPQDPSTDQGGVELDVLASWKRNQIGGHDILAFAAVDHANIEEVKQAVNLFGGIYLGISLPESAQIQDVWDVVPWFDRHGEVGSWGGHAVPVVDYDADGLTCITWGALKRMTWAFFAKYCEESYAIISNDWLNAQGISPSQLDLAALQSDLAAIV